MSRYTQRAAVEMDDGSTWTTTIDQRDLAAWEVCPLYSEQGRTYTMIRYLAWHASHRAGQTDLKWAPFNAACVAAGDPDDEDEPEALVDPTRPARRGGS